MAMKDRTTPIHALIPAAGRGVRFDRPHNKVLATLGGVPIVYRTVAAFAPMVDTATVVGAEAELDGLRDILADFEGKLQFVAGGNTRQDSVRNGLMSLAGQPDDSIVLVHDAARPLVSDAIIERCIASAISNGSGVAAYPVHDTLKRADAAGVVATTVDRSELWSVQTPQAFRLDVLLRASDAAARSGFAGTDEASLVERLGETAVHLVLGSRENIKITTADDLQFAERWRRQGLPQIRVGAGYDVHRLVDGRPLWLGGVKIDYEKGLEGHSDADVVLHALCDSLLGAAGLPDIGKLYPNTDNRFKGTSSIKFVEDVSMRLAQAGWSVGNVDCTLIAERPKIALYSDDMRRTIAQALRIGDSQINIKATTHEGIGALGAGHGIACHASCIIYKS